MGRTAGLNEDDQIRALATRTTKLRIQKSKKAMLKLLAANPNLWEACLQHAAELGYTAGATGI